jgi:hypothetical protein
MMTRPGTNTRWPTCCRLHSISSHTPVGLAAGHRHAEITGYAQGARRLPAPVRCMQATRHGSRVHRPQRCRPSSLWRPPRWPLK